MRFYGNMRRPCLGLAGWAVLTVSSLAAAAPGSFVVHAGPDNAPVATSRSPLIGDQTQVALAAGGGIYFAVWREPVTLATDRILGARLADDGSPIDDPPILLGDATVGRQQHPTVAFDGSRF